MANKLIGVNKAGTLVPYTDEDIFAIAHAKHIRGGWHTEYTTIAERDAIFLDRRAWSMVVALADGTKWELVKGHASDELSDNANWKPFSAESGASAKLYNAPGSATDGAMTQAASTAADAALQAQIDTLVSDLDDAENAIILLENEQGRYVLKQVGKQLTDQNYTLEEKQKLAGLVNFAGEVGDTITDITLDAATKVLTVTTDQGTKTVNLSALVTTNAVTSVNGKVGVVVLTKADIGLGSVDNTRDLNKPVSTAAQTALDLKANKNEVLTESQLAQAVVNVNDASSQVKATVAAGNKLKLALGTDVVSTATIVDGAVGISKLSNEVSTLLNKVVGDTIQSVTLAGTSLSIATDKGTKTVDLSSLAGSQGEGVQAAPSLVKFNGTFDSSLVGILPFGAKDVVMIGVSNGYYLDSLDYTLDLVSSPPTFTLTNTSDMAAGDKYYGVVTMTSETGGGSGSATVQPSFTNPIQTGESFSATAPPYFQIAETEYTKDGGSTIVDFTAGQKSGNIYTIAITQSRPVNTVGMRIKSFQGKAPSQWLFNQSPFAVIVYEPITFQEDDNRVRFSTGWSRESYVGAYGGYEAYITTNVGWYEVTIPNGYSKVRFEGFTNYNGGYFDVLKNGVNIQSGVQYREDLALITYFTVTDLVNGDVIRMVKTGGTALYADQITIYN